MVQPTFEVDNFTREPALAEFTLRQAGVHQVIDRFGLAGVDGESPALLFAGSAMALQGLDARIEGGKPFDVDAHIHYRMLHRLTDEGWISRRSLRLFHATGRLASRHITAPDLALPVQLFCGEFGRDLNEILDSSYSGEVRPDITTKIAGVNVSQATVIARSKVRPYMRVKDVAGILKAHVVGQYTGHPITQEQVWKQSVATAIRRVELSDMSQPAWRYMVGLRPKLPSWLQELKARKFEHPAFEEFLSK